MQIPSARIISNLVQREYKNHKKKLNIAIGDFQDSIQFCYNNSAHRLTQEQYDALPGDRMYYFIYNLHYVYIIFNSNLNNLPPYYIKVFSR